MQKPDRALPEESQWDLLAEHGLESWFSCQWADTEDGNEIARRLGVDPRDGTLCDFQTAMQSYDDDPKKLIVWVGEHSAGWSAILTVSGVTVPPHLIEALSADGKRVLEAYYVEEADPGKLLYTYDREYCGDIFPPSSPGGWMEVPEFEAHASGLELIGEISDAETFDRYLCMAGRITGRFIDRAWFASTRTLYHVPQEA
ncbi:hypothetical protein Ppa06_46380 [Planomonospora parontospora subsp. parontospora]|uniref:Uncharacterized protein n=3 Tax=Planomonospora parontospora TaxID=58119 RepID=A0AA37BKV3_9ACTN|nr:hypothetical protein GCM10010126_52150 [Planomonospora parontospora]GII10840.1 hypothetical protein Ppa06_46380 [Planomonospora parontospora subsp. parontospora]